MWEAIFLLAVLKIPVIYVCLVVWWAIRAVPEPHGGGEPATVVEPSEADPRPGTKLRPPRVPRPHGRPSRTPGRRTARVKA